MASASGTTQNQRVGLGSVLAADHALRRTIRYGIAGRPARAPGFSLLDVGDYDRKHVRKLGGRFAQLRGHWAYAAAGENRSLKAAAAAAAPVVQGHLQQARALAMSLAP